MARKPSYEELKHRVIELEQEAVGRRREEAALRQSKELFEKIFERQLDAIFILDAQIPPTITDCNPAAERVFGYARQEMLGRTTEFLHTSEAGLRDFQKRLYSAITKEGFFHLDHFMMKRKDGTLFPSEHTVVALSGEEGKGIGWVSVVRDITDRKLMEQALGESEKDLNRAQAVARTGSWRLDVGHNKLLWSDETHRIFGIPKGTPMTYETFLASIHANDREYVDRKWTAALRGEPYDIEHRIVVDGEVKWVRERAELEFDLHGVLRGGFGTVQDITERKQAEKALRKKEETARQRAEELQKLMDLAPIAIMVANDPQCRVITGNRAANRLYEAIMGESVSAGPAPGEQDLTRRFFKNGRELKPEELPMHEAVAKAVDVRDSEVDVLLASGRTITMLGSASPLWDAEGRVRGCIAAFVDITQRRKLEEELRRSRDELEMRVQERTAELERSNKELQDFAFIASHDLQEPLRKIRTFGDMIVTRSGTHLGEESRDYLYRMQKAAARMQSLLSSLLEYSRVTANAEPFKLTDLNKTVGVALSNLEILIRDKGGKVELEQLPSLQGDQIQLIQVFQNLIGNALKFHRKGETTLVKIYARPVEQGKKINAYRISVEDNGIGFDEKYLDRIFVPFQKLHGRSEYEGVGMGLAICKKIVDRHGGQITAKSALGKGSAFIITLPARQKKK